MGYEVLTCSDIHEKGTEATSIHIRAGRDLSPAQTRAANTGLGALARRPQGETEADFLHYTYSDHLSLENQVQIYFP